ncbi:MAG TPA: sulfite exporter TauE/SafE family protein [Xanthobacteraceae bacterium]|nr:sulfite exporter TauE/SafE family protein [Xanthobacteraceae bacterium]
MTSDPLFWLLASVGVASLGLSKGGFAGAGMIATPLVSLTMPPLEAAALLLPVQIVQDILAMWMFRRTFSTWNLKVMLPGAFIGVGLAWLLAAHVSDDFIRLLLGVVSIAFVLHAWFAPVPTGAGRPRAAAGLFWGTCAAFSSAICQAGNPPFQVFVLRQNLDKMTYVGTFVMFFGVVNALKVVPYFALGQFSAANFRATLLLLPLAIVANYFGVWLVRRTPTVLFYRIAHILVFVVSLELVRAGALGLWRGV